MELSTHSGHLRLGKAAFQIDNAQPLVQQIGGSAFLHVAALQGRRLPQLANIDRGRSKFGGVSDEPWLDLRCVDLCVELQGQGGNADAERLVWRHWCRSQAGGFWRQIEGVTMPVQHVEPGQMPQG